MRRVLLGILVATGAALPASAHHGFGRFDPSREITVRGVLSGLDFVNPHSYVHFTTTGEDGQPLEMRCEMRAATVLRRSGWSPDLFVVGTNVVIEGRPHRDDPASCYAETLEIGDATFERYQQLDDGGPTLPANRPFRLSNGVPNITGDWAQEQYLIARPPEGRGGLVPKSMVAGIEAGEIDMADVPGNGWGARQVTLTAAGEAAAEALRALPPEQNPRLSCQTTSILFDWVFDGPINQIIQREDTMTMAYGRGANRTIYMGMAAHPADLVPSRTGHSIGRWEGDTLIVDTIGFAPGSIAGSVPHSDQLHVVEQFTLDEQTLALHRTYVAEDPVSFTDQYAGEDTVLPADAPFALDDCEELAYEYRVDSE